MKLLSLISIIFISIILNTLSLFSMHINFSMPKNDDVAEAKMLLNTTHFDYLTIKEKEEFIKRFAAGLEQARNRQQKAKQYN